MKRPLYIAMMVLALAFAAGCASTSKQGAGGTAYRTVVPTDPNFVAANELRLKVREMADQLLASLPNAALTGTVAVPGPFVDLNNPGHSGPLGSYLAEALTYEFNQRGFPVQDRVTAAAAPSSKSKSRGKAAAAGSGSSAVLTGGYQQDPDVIFVTARLVRAADGIVLRTAQVMLTPNAVTLRMTNASPDGTPYGLGVADGGPLFKGSGYGGMRIRQAAPRKTSVAANRVGLWGSQ